MVVCTLTRIPLKGTLDLALLFALPVGLMVIALKEIQQPLRIPYFLLNVLVQTLFYTTILTVSMTLEFYAFRLAGIGFGKDSGGSILAWIRAHPFAGECVYGAFMAWVFIASALRALNRKLGPHVMRNWIMGYYHNPRTEQRVVMFLDLKNSTNIAEQIGDEKFSALIRDFFEALSEPLSQSKGQVSHYIGDEAVITWSPSRMKLGAPLVFFYLLDEIMAKKSSGYIKKFGLVPEFKAGLHVGKVVVTEVGALKSEFVLHGDVLNTTARLEGLCNEKGQRLLISKEAADMLPRLPWFEFENLGEVTLKGKAEAMEICGVRWIPREPKNASGESSAQTETRSTFRAS